MNVAILIPALDEEASLPGLLAAIPHELGARVVVVDNGSTDRTAELARAAGAVVLAEPRRGYGSACRRGISWLQEQGTPPDALVILDADHADDPRGIPALLGLLACGEAELVLTTRTQGTAEPGALGAVQYWGNRLQTAVINTRFGLGLTDMGPLRAIAWEPLLTLDMEDPTWGWNVEMACKAARAGLRVAEIPVPYRKRRQGHSKISGSVKGAARAGGRILWALWRYAR